MGAKRPEGHGLHNRVLAVMMHTTRYAFKGQARLAADCGMSKGAVNRLIAGKTNPSYEVVLAVTEALENHIGRKLGIREIFSFDGTYPTVSICRLVKCQGCLPDDYYDADSNRTITDRDALPGSWTGDQPRLPLVAPGVLATQEAQ